MNRISFLLALGAALVALPATAAPYSGPSSDDAIVVRTTSVDDFAFRLTLYNLQRETTRIVLEDLSGERTYFREFVRNHNGYNRVINLRRLSPGRYILAIRHGDEVRRQVVLVGEEGILLSMMK